MNSDFKNLFDKVLSGESMQEMLDKYREKETIGEEPKGSVKVYLDCIGKLKSIFISDIYISDKEKRDLLIQMLIVAFNDARSNLMEVFGNSLGFHDTDQSDK